MKKTGSNSGFKQRRLGLAAGLLLGRGSKPELTTRQLHQKDFKTSTQHIGIRFSDRLRDILRKGWLKLK